MLTLRESNCRHQISHRLCSAQEYVKETYAEALEEILGITIDIKLTRLGLGNIQSRDLGDILILALTLLLLKLEGDTADGTTLDTLHQMGGVTSNLSTQSISYVALPILERPVEGGEPCCEDAWRQ